MIQLTRLNNHLLIVNPDLIKFVEKSPDTVLTLVSGEKVVVSESVEVVLEKILAFRRSVLSPAKPDLNANPAPGGAAGERNG